MKKHSIIPLVVSFILISSCINVRPYQKAMLNDEDMELGPKLIQGCETAFESYREGASGANGGKVGGGCGCN